MHKLNSNKINVSVVIPFYNRARFSLRFLYSIKCQTLKPDYIFIVDNGSAYEEVMECQKAISSIDWGDTEVTLLSTLRTGNANYARNLGLDLSRSDYVAFLDSDDWWEPLHLETSVDILERSDRVAVYSGAIIHDHGLHINYSSDITLMSNPFELLFSNKRFLAQTSSYVVCKKRLGTIKWDERLKRHQDYDFFISASAQGNGWAFSPTPQVNFDCSDPISNRNFDFESMIFFLNKWREKFPKPQLKIYLKSQLEICYIVNAEKKYIEYYTQEIKKSFGDNLQANLLASPARIKLKQIIKSALKRTHMHRLITAWVSWRGCRKS